MRSNSGGRLHRFWLSAAVLILALGGSVSVQAQTCPAGLHNLANDRFVDQGDGTVLDSETGLLWLRCSWGSQWAVAQCDDEPVQVPWSEALTLADELVSAGSANWRLPNINELQSIVEWGCFDPAVKMLSFPDVVNGRYWSSSARKVGESGVVLTVDFYNGRVRDATLDSGYVLFVRQMQ